MKKELLIMFVLPVCFISCITAPSYYVMNDANISLLKKKNDLIASATRGMGDNYITTDGHITYALTKHLGIMMNGSYAFLHDDDDKGNFNHSKRKQVELALGYYLPKEIKMINFKTHYISEYYFGSGIGNIKVDYNDNGRGGIYEIHRSNFSKLFIQTNHGIVAKYIELGVSMRLCHLNYYDYKSKLSDGSNINVSKYSGYFLERFGVIKLGLKNVKLYYSLGASDKAFKHLKLNSENNIYNIGIESNITNLF